MEKAPVPRRFAGEHFSMRGGGGGEKWRSSKHGLIKGIGSPRDNGPSRA